ncbi:MAG: serine/threonine protein kinase [Pseudomonadota bacterium]|nr:serine/threonine protein kinase [Pseudomonadota bacterium]
MLMYSVEELRLLSGLLEEALDLPESEREAWLSTLPEPAAALSTALREMLGRAGSLGTDDLLARGLADIALDPEANKCTPHDLTAGATLGPYRLVRELGRGGMGEVWLAERVDGQLKREVALKLPMLGLRRSLLVERFARERDILASLVHPHIAQLYDAGVTQDGQPYMALEYVQGTSLTAYCEAHRLGVRERLALVMQVLDAVQYAHNHLVIHRDLKPGNILVTADGQVRLLDFGVAKLLAEDGEERTSLTRIGGQAFTPDYASPEQVRGAPLGTTSDVYSLGVVLYELLCGQRPYTLKMGSAVQIEQAILEVEPPLPSAVITAAAAGSRSASFKELQKSLRGDLDTIVLKALKKTSQERYGTVAELAADLRRFRDGEPVLARPDTWGYRARKYVRRNLVAVVSAAAVLLSLTGGLGVALWQRAEALKQAHVAQAERDLARRAARRGEALAIFMEDTVQDLARSRAVPAAQDLLLRSEADLEARYADDPALLSDLLAALGRIHFSVNSDDRGLALLRKAEALLTDAADPGQRAEVICHRIAQEHMQGLKAFEDAASGVLDIGNRPDLPTGTRAECLNQLARMQIDAGRLSEAADSAQQALALLKAAGDATPDTPAVLGILAAAQGRMGRAREADQNFQIADALIEKLHQGRTNSANTLRSNWAAMLVQAGSPRRALQLQQKVLANSAPATSSETASPRILYTAGGAALELGQFALAKTYFERAAPIAQASHDDLIAVLIHCKLAVTDLYLGAPDDAEHQYERAAAIHSPALEQAGALSKSVLALTRTTLDNHRREFEEAKALASRVVVTAAPMKPYVAQALTLRAEAETGLAQLDAALADANAAVALCRQLQGGLDASARTGAALLALAKAQLLQGHRDEARAAGQDAFEQLSRSVEATHPALLEARSILMQLQSRPEHT